MRVFLIAACLTLVAWTAACSRSNPAPSALSSSASSGRDSSAPPSPVEDGRALFVANCVGCHGKSADGNTPAGKVWHVPNLHFPGVQAQSDQQLLLIMREGKGKMPAWGGLLSPIDLQHLLVYIRSLADKG